MIVYIVSLCKYVVFLSLYLSCIHSPSIKKGRVHSLRIMKRSIFYRMEKITTTLNFKDVKSIVLKGKDNPSSGPKDVAELPTRDEVTLTEKLVNCKETCALMIVNNGEFKFG